MIISMQTTFRIIELMHEFVLFFSIAFPNCFYCDLFFWNKKQPTITDFQLSCTICCLFCRCRGVGDLTVNQFFSSSIWLCCLIITIDKTWSNLSNHDLIFFFFQKREGGPGSRIEPNGGLLSLSSYAASLYV